MAKRKNYYNVKTQVGRVVAGSERFDAALMARADELHATIRDKDDVIVYPLEIEIIPPIEPEPPRLFQVDSRGTAEEIE